MASHRRPIGRGVLHQGFGQDRLSLKHQIELEEICLPSKTKIDKGLKSEKRYTENMEEGLVSLKSMSKKSARELPAERLADIDKTLKLLVEAMTIKPSEGGNFRSRTTSPSTAGAQGRRSL